MMAAVQRDPLTDTTMRIPPDPSSIISLKRNVQGDILIGLPKNTETFFFFAINATKILEFRTQIKEFAPLVATTEEVERFMVAIAAEKAAKSGRLLPFVGVGIAFSNEGLKKVGLNVPGSPSINDVLFERGMVSDAPALGEQASHYIPEFRQEQHKIDGVILVAGSDRTLVDDKLKQIKALFHVGTKDASIGEIISIVGDVRPGEERGHEHFGFNDGVSQPAVKDIDTHPNPGQDVVEQGRFVIGRPEDNDDNDQPMVRPDWAKDGSFLCFRQLKQNVPEFNKFIDAKRDPDLPPDWGRGQLGARLVGRWKSGAPTDLTPMVDNTELANDETRNNDFEFNPASQERCPFAAHIRKMYPRKDFDEDINDIHRILRRGITYGPELTPAEIAGQTTQQERGLLFVSYQSNIDHGFAFLQKVGANKIDFPPGKPQVPGWDPIIGQNDGDATTEDTPRALTGTQPDDVAAPLQLDIKEWVITKGGEYLFAPSMSCLRHHIAQ